MDTAHRILLKRRSILYALVFTVCFSGFGREKGGFMKQPIRSFSVSNVSRLDALLALAKQQKQPLGVEYVGPELFEPVSLNVESTSIGSVLETLFPSKRGFRVSIDNGVLLIENIDVSEKRPNALDTVISHFSIPRCSVLEAEALLRAQLSQQLSGMNQTGYGISVSDAGGATVGPFVLTHATVRQVLNRIVHDRGAAAWVAQVEPSALQQPLSAETARSLLDGRETLWTVVDYDGRLFEKIGQITQEHAHAVPPLHP